jgi:predicted negative regulator of RcsB-dependent stress response
MAAGESEEAERMLRAAVAVLDGWDRAVARADLASVLMATERGDEAIVELEEACQCPLSSEEQEGQMLEMRIRLAHLLVQAERTDEAEEILLGAKPGHESLAAAMAGEALAEFYVGQGRHDEALAILRPALTRLSEESSDRAASAAVTLAYASQCSGASGGWEALATLPSDLQGAAIVNFCDRLPSFDREAARAMLDALLARLEGKTSWDWECEQLHAAAKQLDEAGS